MSPGLKVLMETIFTLSNILYFSTTLQMLKNLGAEMDALVDFPPIDLVRATYPPTINPVTYSDTYEHKVTPLIFMLSQRHYEAVERLLKMGASPSQPDCQGVTPLMYAARLVSWSETYFPKYFETQYGYSNLIDSVVCCDPDFRSSDCCKFLAHVCHSSIAAKWFLTLLGFLALRPKYSKQSQYHGC